MTRSEHIPRGEVPARFYETADNRAPQGGASFWLTTSDGARLRIAVWHAPRPRGTAVVLPGRTETIEKYFETAADLLHRDFNVLIFDWRGQGASSRELTNPMKGHIASFDVYVGDLAAVLDEVEDSCPRPWIVLGHSMGANIALLALHEWPQDFSAAVLCAPMLSLRLPVPPLIHALARVAPPRLFIPRGRAHDPVSETFAVNPVTHDEVRFTRNQGIFKAHREIAVGAPTWGWLNAALEACARWGQPGFVEKVRTPTLLLSAGDELIVENSAQDALAARLKVCEHVLIAGTKHEILMEGDAIRAQFWAAFDGFLARHVNPI